MNATELMACYFNFCSQTGLSPEEVVVSAGGALVMLGLRGSTSDLDLDVSDDVYRLLKPGKVLRHCAMGEFYDYDNTVSLQSIPKEVEVMVVNGVSIYSIPTLLWQKGRMSALATRPADKVEQDKRDIQSLQQLLDRVNH